MNRLIEIIAMALGSLSLFLVCFVGFTALSGRDMSQVAVIGKLFPAPPEEGGASHGESPEAETQAEPGGQAKSLSDTAVIEASLGVLSAWTLPSPYSTSELRVLSEEIKMKHAELEEHENALTRRERAVERDELEIDERLKSMEDLRMHLESLQQELAQREIEISGKENAAKLSQEAGWADLAGVIGAIEEPPMAAKRLQEFEPAEAAKILRALGDDARAGEILNAVDGARWKEYAAAYTAEPPYSAKRRK